MQQSVKVKLHWGSPSLSWTTGLKTKCTQSEHMSAERDKTPPVAHRYAPFILQCSQLLLSLNHKELSLCSKSDLWPYQCFLCTCVAVAVDSAVLLTLISESFMISSPNPSWQFVCVSLFWCHTALKWSDNSITHVGLECTNIWIKPYEALPSVLRIIKSLSQVQLRSWLFYMFFLTGDALHHELVNVTCV